MGQFFNSINEVRKNYNKFDAWEQDQADERAKKEYLAKNLDIPEDKVELTKNRAQTVIRATEIMDARSEDNCEDMEQLTGILTAIPLFGLQLGQIPLTEFLDKKFTAKIKKEIEKLEEKRLNGITPDEINKLEALRSKKFKISDKVRLITPFAMLGVVLATGIVTILWSNSKQKEASRIGRFQAKQKELKGLENFVMYTPEQIEKAKEIAKKIPNEKDKNAISKMIKELKDISKDKKAYKKWLSEKDPKEIEKLKQVNLSPEQLQKAQEDKELIVDVVKEINIKAEEYSENVENAFDTMGTVSWLAAIPLGFGINKLMNLAKVKSKGIRTGVSLAVPLLTSLGIQLMGTFEQKKASRVGRYKARQDLLKNPARLMAYSDEEMKKAKNIKAPKVKQGFFDKLGDSFSFIGKYYKDKKQYNKYKKTTQKENEKLQKALKQIETTDEQKAEAKALQKNVFRAFDEVDEMSQRYSEDVEAGTEIAKNVGVTAWSLGALGATALFGYSVAKGKFPIAKIGNWLTNLTFDAKSPIRKSVNKFYDILKQQDKKVIQDFQQSIVTGDLKEFFAKPENKALKEAIGPCLEELAKISENPTIKKLVSGEKSIDNPKDLSKVIKEIVQSQFKQTWLAKWGRNMFVQGSKLWIKIKASNAGMEIPAEAQKAIGMNFNYKNYNTLINTGLVAGIPILGTIIGIPYAFNSWLTSIQKKAGKIGIMKAMDKIDDPRVFAQQDTQQTTPSKEEPKQSNLLKQVKQ